MRQADQILAQSPALLGKLTRHQVEVVDPALAGNSANASDLLLKAGPYFFVIEAKSNANVVSIERAVHQIRNYLAHCDHRDARGLIVVPFMGEKGRQICAREGVGFVDLSGNALIDVPGLYVHIEGKPNRFIRRGRPASIFAPKSSRVTRALLHDPTRWWSSAALAERTRLGVGYINKICVRLQQDQLIERNTERAFRPRDPNLLLDAWQAEYSIRKHTIIQGHLPARSSMEILETLHQTATKSHVEYALTGLPAAYLMAPFADYRLVAAYFAKYPTDEFLNELSFKPAKHGANCWLIIPNDEGVFQDQITISSFRCVAPIQVYLDLKGMPERADEAADFLRRERLNWT